MNKRTVGAMVVVLAGLCNAHSGVVRVTPELPMGSDGSGDSWANATDNLAWAYEAAAGMDGGGEVWLKTGVYSITDGIAIRSNVAVIGGFAGAETSVDQANPTANPVILTGDTTGDNVWRLYRMSDNVLVFNGAAVRNGLTINEPPDATVRDDRYMNVGNGGNDTLICFDDRSGALTNVVFRGITLCGFRQALYIGSGSYVEVDNCRFVACSSEYSKKAVDTWGVLNLHDSEFIGCTAPLHYSDSVAGATNYIDNCVIRDCSSPYQAVIYFGTQKALVMRKTRIYRNVAYSDASFVLCLMCSASSVVEDCTIETNLANTVKSYVTYLYRANMTRCVIRGNRTVVSDASNANATHASGLRVNGACIIRDTLFDGNTSYGNRSDASTVKHYWASAVAVVDDGAKATLLNCTFRGNTVTTTTNANNAGGTFVVAAKDANRALALVNCVVADSLIADGSEIFCLNAGVGDEKNTTIAVINTVVQNGAVGYMPFVLPASVSPGIANSSISSYDASVIPTGNNGYLYSISMADASLDKLKQGDNGAWALGIRATSSFTRAGRPVWLQNDGKTLWFYDADLPWPWRKVNDKTSSTTFVSGLTASSDPVPDAFGEARALNKIAYGPLNAMAGPTLVIIR